MRKYSVLLLYPDYATENYGADTFLAHVKADTATDAEDTARREASLDTGLEGLEIEWSDWGCLLVTRGHLEDLTGRGDL